MVNGKYELMIKTINVPPLKELTVDTYVYSTMFIHVYTCKT